MRVVFDTNVLVRANPKASGSAHKALYSIISGPHTLILSPFLLQEVERVLAYPRLQTRWALTQSDIQKYLQLLGNISTLVYPTITHAIVLDDPDDDAVIQTAVIGSAQALCTLDQHFYGPSVKAYCIEHGITLVTDVELLQLL